jgi:hypothetical protein
MSFAMNTCGGKKLIGESSYAVLFSVANSVRFRPKEFVKASAYPEDSDEEESTVGKMPPSDSEDE